MDPNAPRRVATETVTADIDGVTTVVAEKGQVVPLAYEHLVPEGKAAPLDVDRPTRSTSNRRAAAAALEGATADDGDEKSGARRRSGAKADK